MYRVLELNPQLQPFAGDIELRMYNYNSTKERLMPQGGTLKDFANVIIVFYCIIRIISSQSILHTKQGMYRLSILFSSYLSYRLHIHQKSSEFLLH